MPCSDSSSSLSFVVDKNDCFISSEYAKITCGQDIKGIKNLQTYLLGRSIEDITKLNFVDFVEALHLEDEEEQYLVYLEWDALRCALALYLGIEEESIDTHRGAISSIDDRERETEVSVIILPPQELPSVLSCGVKEKQDKEEG